MSAVGYEDLGVSSPAVSRVARSEDDIAIVFIDRTMSRITNPPYARNVVPLGRNTRFYDHVFPVAFVVVDVEIVDRVISIVEPVI
jgi:hypothetical protein